MQTTKITFEELQHRVANVDYIWDDSFPVRFSVTNGETTQSYEIGIGEIIDNDRYNDIIGGDGQYIALIDNDTIADDTPAYDGVMEIVDADSMVYKEIGETLRDFCEITDESIITLTLIPEEYKGTRMKFSEDELTNEAKHNLEKIMEWEN